MGMRPSLSLLAGAVCAWGVLGPTARSRGWAQGKIFDFEYGAQGWVLWVAIALMVGESLTAFALVVLQQAGKAVGGGGGGGGGRRGGGGAGHKRNGGGGGAKTNGGGGGGGGGVHGGGAGDHAGAGVRGGSGEEMAVIDPLEVAPASQLVPTSWWLGGVVAATALCVAVVAPMFSMPMWQVAFAVGLSCLVAVLAVRALGQTDLNPVSGVGKLSQIVFAVVAPGHVVANIVAGALAEAGAMQAGDLLQDLKAGHLLRASPRAQFYGQLIGASVSVVVTVAAYRMYETAYGIPSPQFPAPVANVWKDMAVLMQKGTAALPPSALGYAQGFGVIGVALALAEALGPVWLLGLLPSGMSLGIGMYLTPDSTLPRVIGALLEFSWRHASPASHRRSMLVVASGFVLGEGVWSIVALGLKSVSVAGRKG